MTYVFTCSGLGCEFVLESCNNPNTYPYLCDTAVLHQCTFDHISKVCTVHYRIRVPYCPRQVAWSWSSKIWGSTVAQRKCLSILSWASAHPCANPHPCTSAYTNPVQAPTPDPTEATALSLHLWFIFKPNEANAVKEKAVLCWSAPTCMWSCCQGSATFVPYSMQILYC